MRDYEGRPGADEFAPYYRPYVALVPEGGIVGILARQIDETVALLSGLTEAQAEHAYAEGKWTIKEVVGHLTDSERVFAYRALRFARGDATELASFDENAYVPGGEFGARPFAELLDELQIVRRATVALLGGLPEAAWTRRGRASGVEVSVRALATIIAGHELHHRAILTDRYLPGIPEGSGGTSRSRR